MHHRIVLVVALLVAFAGCHDAPSGPAAVQEGRALAPGEITASARWMRATRVILGRREVGSPLMIARNAALVAVAAYNAATTAGDAAATAGRTPSEAGAVAGASAAVLRALYPMEDTAITAQLTRDRAYFATFDGELQYDFAAGETAGTQVAVQVMASASADRTSLGWTGNVPVGPGYWRSAPAPAAPVAPRWGEARAWFLTSGAQFRPVAPPSLASAAFDSALVEVRTLTRGRTADQLTRAQFWQFASGPAGPIGHFSEIAIGLAEDARYNERQSARVQAVLQMAVMDATIGCWDAKYAYWLVRPFQADTTITTPVGRPNFPSYPSAHSCIAGTAATVLSSMFPSAKPAMDEAVAEAGLSRIHAGLHYRFDIVAGDRIGAQVAELALARTPRARTLIPLP